jgi:mono/diheme cytochrome c family protein
MVLKFSVMKKTVLFIAVVTAGLFFAQSCGNDAVKENKDSATPSVVEPTKSGSVLYEEKCMLCHGADGKQNTMGATDLSASALNHETVVAVITSGRNGMRAFSPELNAEQIEAVAKYVESLRK